MPQCIPEGFDKERIVAAAFELIVFLDRNLGDNADWPLTLSANDDQSLSDVVDKLNELRDACGLKKVNHDHLYQRPPEPGEQ